MRRGQAIKRRLIAFLAPEDGEFVFFATFEIGRAHGGPDEVAT
jgi:hypothetical protein